MLWGNWAAEKEFCYMTPSLSPSHLLYLLFIRKLLSIVLPFLEHTLERSLIECLNSFRCWPSQISLQLQFIVYSSEAPRLVTCGPPASSSSNALAKQRSAKHILQLKLWSAQRILIVVSLGCNLGTSWTMIKRQQQFRQCRHRIPFPCCCCSCSAAHTVITCLDCNLSARKFACNWRREKVGMEVRKVKLSVWLGKQSAEHCYDLGLHFGLWFVSGDSDSRSRSRSCSCFLFLLLLPIPARAAFVGAARLCWALNLCTISPVECACCWCSKWKWDECETNSCVNFHFNCRLCILTCACVFNEANVALGTTNLRMIFLLPKSRKCCLLLPFVSVSSSPSSPFLLHKYLYISHNNKRHTQFS